MLDVVNCATVSVAGGKLRTGPHGGHLGVECRVLIRVEGVFEALREFGKEPSACNGQPMSVNQNRNP